MFNLFLLWSWLCFSILFVGSQIVENMFGFDFLCVIISFLLSFQHLQQDLKGAFMAITGILWYRIRYIKYEYISHEEWYRKYRVWYWIRLVILSIPCQKVEVYGLLHQTQVHQVHASACLTSKVLVTYQKKKKTSKVLVIDMCACARMESCLPEIPNNYCLFLMEKIFNSILFVWP